MNILHAPAEYPFQTSFEPGDSDHVGSAVFQAEGVFIEVGTDCRAYPCTTSPGVADLYPFTYVETADPSGPWGARGLGEMPFIPLAPALAAAVHAATGVWIDQLPLTPERVLSSLTKSQEGD